MDVFFYHVMIGGETFFGVFKQILDICLVKNLSFTKKEIDDMPPFERTSYVELIREHLEDLAEQQKQLEQNAARKHK